MTDTDEWEGIPWVITDQPYVMGGEEPTPMYLASAIDTLCDGSAYWSADPHHPSVRTFDSKKAAVAAVREEIGRMPRHYKAVQLPVDFATEMARIAKEQASPEALDLRLRSQARDIAQSMVEFKELIVTAREGRIHEALGFKSWEEYIADVIQTEMGVLPTEDRLQIVAVLRGDQKSEREIAAIIGVSQKTVNRDLKELSHDDSVDLPDTVVGLDGKERPAHPPTPPPPPPKPQPPPPAPKPEPITEPEPSTIHIPATIEDAAARLEEINAENEALHAAMDRWVTRLRAAEGDIVLTASEANELADLLNQAW
jgi:hypothetical protein